MADEQYYQYPAGQAGYSYGSYTGDSSNSQSGYGSANTGAYTGSSSARCGGSSAPAGNAGYGANQYGSNQSQYSYGQQPSASSYSTGNILRVTSLKSRSFSATSILRRFIHVGGWRLRQGLPAEGREYDPITDLPDWSYAEDAQHPSIPAGSNLSSSFYHVSDLGTVNNPGETLSASTIDFNEAGNIAAQQSMAGRIQRQRTYSLPYSFEPGLPDRRNMCQWRNVNQSSVAVRDTTAPEYINQSSNRFYQVGQVPGNINTANPNRLTEASERMVSSLQSPKKFLIPDDYAAKYCFQCGKIFSDEIDHFYCMKCGFIRILSCHFI